jgi:hypothetical protein
VLAVMRETVPAPAASNNIDLGSSLCAPSIGAWEEFS